MSEKLIVQIVGQPASGKGEISSRLAEAYGFEVVTVSDIIRSYAIQRQLPLKERRDFLDAHAKMRKEFGHQIITDTITNRTAEKINVDGIRVPADVATLRGKFGAISIAAWCPIEIRLERAINRKGPLDKTTLEDFRADEENENYDPDPNNQNTLQVMEEADYHVDSSKPLVEVCADVGRIVEQHFAISPIK